MTANSIDQGLSCLKTKIPDIDTVTDKTGTGSDFFNTAIQKVRKMSDRLARDAANHQKDSALVVENDGSIQAMDSCPEGHFTPSGAFVIKRFESRAWSCIPKKDIDYAVEIGIGDAQFWFKRWYEVDGAKTPVPNIGQ